MVDDSAGVNRFYRYGKWNKNAADSPVVTVKWGIPRALIIKH